MHRDEPDIEALRPYWPRLARDVLGPTLEALSAMRRAGDGDIELFLIILAVALRTIEHKDFQTLNYTAIPDGNTAQLPSLTTNVTSIAASLGMPKETVRRKVERLVAAGWIERDGVYLRLGRCTPATINLMRDAVLGAVLKQYLAVHRALSTGSSASGAGDQVTGSAA